MGTMPSMFSRLWNRGSRDAASATSLANVAEQLTVVSTPTLHRCHQFQLVIGQGGAHLEVLQHYRYRIFWVQAYAGSGHGSLLIFWQD